MTKEYSYTNSGPVDFIEPTGNGYITGQVVEPEKIQELIDSGVEIAPYVEPVKTAEQLKAEVVQDLKSLDASPRMITEAFLGDQWAIDELKRLEAEKVILRDKLNSL